MPAEDFFHYLPVNDDAMAWGVYLTSVGRITIPPQQTYPPDGHPAVYQFAWQRGRILPEFALVFVSAGRGVFESHETGEVHFQGPTVLFLFPDVWHRYRPDLETGWSERWICFNGEIAHRLLGLHLITPRSAVLAIDDAQRLAQQFDELLQRVRKNPVANSILLSLHGLGLVADALLGAADAPRPVNSFPNNLAKIDDPVTVQAMDLIWTHSHRPISVSDIARQLPVTRRTLDRRFAAATGRSVLDEINACRMSRAKRLLVETSLPIKTVAYLAGFSCVERMRVLFVEEQDVSPSRYRALHAAKRT